MNDDARMVVVDGDARVLIVDDDANLLNGLRRQLGRRFALTLASSGDEALELIRTQGPFAAALCDMRMPGMDGLQLMEKLREISPDTVRMMLTGNADQKTAIEAINTGGIFRFFNKPCPPDILIEGVAGAIHQYRLLQSERALAENEERWRLALLAVGDGVWDWSPCDGRMVFSEGWTRMLGCAENEIAQTEQEWRNRIHPDDRAMVQDALDRHFKGETPTIQCEHRLRCQDGGYKWVLMRGVALSRKPDGQPVRVVGTSADVSERRQMEETLRRQAEELLLLATTDELTGLWNRRHFLAKANEEVARAERYNTPVSMMMLDIDFFKKVNDTYGHAAGDLVLRHLSTILKAKLRRTDIVGRLGGEEFAILLPQTTIDEAETVAESLRQAIATTPSTLADGVSLTTTVSLGLTTMLPVGDNVADMLRRSDDCLYKAKQSGRNRVVRET